MTDPKVKIRKQDKNDDLQTLTKEELIAKIKALEAHNTQLKNIIAKTGPENRSDLRNKPFDFEKCHFRHILLKFFYLGWDYKGYAVQEDTTETIEYYLFKALRRTCLIKDRASSNYHRCGRTDKGVSSFGQVISLDVRSKLTKENETDLEKELDYCQMLNNVLPENIQCVAWCPVDKDYSARFDCNYRTYKYFFPQGSLDIEKMRHASKLLIGSHDYRNFCKMDVGNGVVEFIRRIDEISIEALSTEGEYSMFVISIKGKAFLWHQIRCIMGVLFLIGQNKEDCQVISQLLDVKANPRKPEYSMASETPLNLYYCDYSDVQWFQNPESVANVVKKLKKLWCFHSVKQSMIKSMLNDLQQTDQCVAEFLIQGVKPKNYIPLLKRQKCESLEEKIKHFTKRKRIEVI